MKNNRSRAATSTVTQFYKVNVSQAHAKYKPPCLLSQSLSAWGAMGVSAWLVEAAETVHVSSCQLLQATCITGERVK